MKNIFLFIIFCLCSLTVFSQNKEDIWSGTYVLKMHNDSNTIIDTLVIEPASTLNKDDVAGKYEADLKRWTIYSKKDTKKDKQPIRRFLFNEENNEYEEFGWTTLHKNSSMDCIDGGHFFICQSNQKGSLKIGNETFELTTNLFGIWLHYGLYNLEKISN